MRLTLFSGPRLHKVICLGVLLIPYTALAADDRPATLASAGGNPLALSAMAFLGWYWKLFLVLAGLSAAVRMFGGGLGAQARSWVGLEEDPYLMAYLAGGPQRVLDAVIASLVQQGALRVNVVTRELIAEEELVDDRPKIERRARALLWGSHQVEDVTRFRRWLQGELRASLAVMRQRLLKAGLLARPPLQAAAKMPLTIGFGVLLAVGVVRLVLGIAAGRPVGFLVLSMIATVAVAWWLLRGMGKERATAHGKRLLDDCKSHLGRGGGEDKFWTVALLGLAGYGMGPMADLSHVMQVSPTGGLLVRSGRKRTRGDSSGAGTGCGGSGCGGGGCGGCGG